MARTMKPSAGMAAAAAQDPPGASSRLVVKNLGPSVDEARLRSHFEAAGEVPGCPAPCPSRPWLRVDWSPRSLPSPSAGNTRNSAPPSSLLARAR